MHAEVIIIGGGVIGTACAYFLSQRGVKVLLLECSHLGAGASGTTAAIVNIGGTSGPAEPLRPLNNDEVSRVITGNGDYHADWVVVAAGARTPEILASSGMEVPIVPARGQVILTEPCSLKTEHLLFFADHLYLKQTAAGNFYLGSHTEFVGFDSSITLDKIAGYTRVFARAVPMLARLRALRFFSGFRPISADNLPLIGPVPDCSRLIIASAHGRTGVRYSASTGKAVSELIVDGKTEHPIEAFAVDRFARTAGGCEQDEADASAVRSNDLKNG